MIHRVCDAEHLRPQFDELIWQAYRAAELELCNYPSNYCSAKNSIKGILVYLTKDAYSLKKIFQEGVDFYSTQMFNYDNFKLLKRCTDFLCRIFVLGLCPSPN